MLAEDHADTDPGVPPGQHVHSAPHVGERASFEKRHLALELEVAGVDDCQATRLRVRRDKPAWRRR